MFDEMGSGQMSKVLCFPRVRRGVKIICSPFSQKRCVAQHFGPPLRKTIKNMRFIDKTDTQTHRQTEMNPEPGRPVSRALLQLQKVCRSGNEASFPPFTPIYGDELV